MIDPLKIQKKNCLSGKVFLSVIPDALRSILQWKHISLTPTSTRLLHSLNLKEKKSQAHIQKTGLSSLHINQISVLDWPSTSEAGSCSDCTHRLWMRPDVWFSFSPRCPTGSSELRLSLKLSLFPLRAKASLPAERSNTHTHTHTLVLKTDRRCVNAHAGLSWGSRCWKLSLESNTANCWVTDTHTQPFN